MELNEGAVKKALDWLDSLVGNSNDSDIAMFTYQLLGILYDTCEELTEENERLRAEVNRLDALSDEMGVDIDVKLKTIFELEDKLKAEKADVMYFKDQIRADTVRKMHSEIKERCIKGGIYPAFVASTIDRIAKEMLEGANEEG